jgi:hypothetical protein
MVRESSLASIAALVFALTIQRSPAHSKVRIKREIVDFAQSWDVPTKTAKEASKPLNRHRLSD